MHRARTYILVDSSVHHQHDLQDECFKIIDEQRSLAIQEDSPAAPAASTPASAAGPLQSAQPRQTAAPAPLLHVDDDGIEWEDIRGVRANSGDWNDDDEGESGEEGDGSAHATRKWGAAVEGLHAYGVVSG